MKVIAKSSTAQVPESVIGQFVPVYDIDARLGVGLTMYEVPAAAPKVKLWGIKVGEAGRNRWEAFLNVDDSEPGAAQRTLRWARIGKTRSDFPKLLALPAPMPPGSPAEYALVVLSLSMGYRGGNGYSGDCLGDNDEGKAVFAESPWIPLAIGNVADGDAGGMAQGTQMVALLPKGVVGRTYRYGRLYGQPGSHYYLWDGVTLHRRTADERRALADVPGDPYPPML